MSDARIWLPLNIGRYLKNTRDLSLAEHGAYLLLIMEYWNRQGPLPDDMERLARIINEPPATAKPILRRVSEYFEPVNGKWHHNRIEKDLKEAQALVEKKKRQTEGARKAREKKLKNNVTNSVTESVTETPSPSPSPSPSSIPSSSRLDISQMAACADALGDKLRNSSPDYHTLESLISDGCSLEMDILPLLQERGRSLRRIVYSFAAFRDDILRRRDKRLSDKKKGTCEIIYTDDEALDSFIVTICEAISPEAYRVWFQSGGQRSLYRDGETVIVRVPSVFVRSQLRERYGDLMDKIFGLWKIEIKNL